MQARVKVCGLQTCVHRPAVGSCSCPAAALGQEVAGWKRARDKVSLRVPRRDERHPEQKRGFGCGNAAGGSIGRRKDSCACARPGRRGVLACWQPSTHEKLRAFPAAVAGARVYVTMFPCNECAKLMIQVPPSSHGCSSARAPHLSPPPMLAPTPACPHPPPGPRRASHNAALLEIAASDSSTCSQAVTAVCRRGSGRWFSTRTKMQRRLALPRPQSPPASSEGGGRGCVARCPRIGCSSPGLVHCVPARNERHSNAASHAAHVAPSSCLPASCTAAGTSSMPPPAACWLSPASSCGSTASRGPCCCASQTTLRHRRRPRSNVAAPRTGLCTKMHPPWMEAMARAAAPPQRWMRQYGTAACRMVTARRLRLRPQLRRLGCRAGGAGPGGTTTRRNSTGISRGRTPNSSLLQGSCKRELAHHTPHALGIDEPTKSPVFVAAAKARL